MSCGPQRPRGVNPWDCDDTDRLSLDEALWLESQAASLQRAPLGAKLDGDLMHTEQPTELKHITQWRKSKQLRLLQ